MRKGKTGEKAKEKVKSNSRHAPFFAGKMGNGVVLADL